jgi:hypothetical protein
MFQLMGAQITFKNVNNPGQQSGSLLPGDFVLDDSLFSIPDDFVVNPANASSLFSHFGLFESDDFNSTNGIQRVFFNYF